MERKKTIHLGILLFGFGTFGIYAQEATLVGGGDATGDGTVSYSMGQVLYNTSSGVDGTVSQGVQQAYEISTAVGLEETNIRLTFYTYPNPTSDFLTIEYEGIPESELSYVLYDMNGKPLESNSIIGSITMLNMKQYTTGNYFLQVRKNGQQVKAFKIIKHL